MSRKENLIDRKEKQFIKGQPLYKYWDKALEAGGIYRWKDKYGNQWQITDEGVWEKTSKKTGLSESGSLEYE